MLRLTTPRRLPRLELGLAIALLAGGCSADVARFDSPTFNLTESKAATPLPAEPMRRADSAEPANPSGGAYFPPASKTPAVRVAGLPEAAPPPQPFTAPAPRAQQIAAAPRAAALAPAPATPLAGPAVASASGDQVVVQPGDTLFGLAKKHNVSVGELMSVNDLKTPAIKPGQKLVLPSGKSAAKKPLVRTEPAKLAATPAPAAIASAAPSDWTGSYTVKSGDSPYGIARQHKVSLDELSRVNGITDPRKMMPGVVLKVPSGHAAATTAAAPAAPAPIQPVAAVKPAAAPAAAAPAPEAPRVVQTTTKPVLINSAPPTQVAALGSGETETATDATPAPASAKPAGKFRWPAKGKIVSNFGPRPDGTHNDGVNITVPLGTDVLAAEQGVVAYAGSELKGYGNLVLLRHDNGWVTAYAHNDEILVKRGDKVKRGQAVAKAGKTGTVDQPQVHFELRQGSKPVDPMPHMEKL